MNSLLPAALRQTIFGVLAVVISLPVLFAIHNALSLGSPPISGLLLLGGSVVLAFAVSGALGVAMGQAKAKPLLAGLLGLGVGALTCAVVAPFYGSMVVEGLTRDAGGLVLSERGRITDAARNVVSGGAGNAVEAARQGRVQEQIEALQKQARDAATPQAREAAAQKARELTAQLGGEAKTKGIALVKSGVARLTAFALLFWALIGPPFSAGLECRKARR